MHIFISYPQQLIKSRKYKAKPENKVKRQTKKLDERKQNANKKAIAYGSNLDGRPDISTEKLKQLCVNFLQKNVKNTDDEIQQIELASVDQRNSNFWKKGKAHKTHKFQFW